VKDWNCSTDLPLLRDSASEWHSRFEVKAYPVLQSSGNT